MLLKLIWVTSKHADSVSIRVSTCLRLLWRRCLALSRGADGSEGDSVQGRSLQACHSAWGTGHHGLNDCVPIFSCEQVACGPWHSSPLHSDAVADFWICLINSWYFRCWKKLWSCALARIFYTDDTFHLFLPKDIFLVSSHEHKLWLHFPQKEGSWVWWCTPVVQLHKRWRQEDEIKARLDNLTRLCLKI